MENNQFQISPQIIWILGITNFLIFVAAMLNQIQKWEISQILIIIGLIIFILTWIIILIDISKNKIYNKSFWLMSIFILPSITPIIYVIRREKLIRFAGRLVN